MKSEKRRNMRRDCARLMAGAIVATCLECLLAMAAPTVVSLLLGDMADALLALEVAAIETRFPAFLGGILVTVLVAPGMTLVKNLLLTRQGTAYDMFLMESTMGLPHKSLHQVDAGDYLHRFEVDRTLYYCCVVRLLSCPPAIVAYGVFFAWMVRGQSYPWGYCLWVLVLSGASVAYDAARARRKAEWNKETADYEGQRTQLELELLALRDVSHGFGLHPFLLDRMRHWFDRYWKCTGRRQCAQTAMSQTLQGFWDYGVQVGCILVGAVLVARGQLTLGGLLGGYLLLPTVKQFWVSVRQLVEDVQSERTYGARMEYFYQAREEEPDEGTIQSLETLALHNVGFSYAAEDMPVLSQINWTLSTGDRVQMMGENGCGKSTLASLLGGIYPPDQGEILDERGAVVSLQRLRRSVALQEQDSVIFTGTVWDNLFLPEHKREAAAQLLADLAFAKPLEYAIAGDGKNLSPGERKKILLTRALLKEAPFLLLDEPLNHLDSVAREALAVRLEERRGGLLLISHDPWLPERLGLEKRWISAELSC